jgi:K+-sensing histidine kinase KdpD
LTQPPYDQLPNPYGITTSLTAPMRVGGAVVGMLSLDYGGQRHEFVPREIALAEAVAQLAAMVIERERLLREREEGGARELALLTVNQHMDDFLSMAAHDMKSPVAGAKLVTQTAQRRIRRLTAEVRAAAPALEQRADDLERAFDTVTDQMNRLALLVERLLDVTRARTGKLEATLEPCDLAPVVRQAVERQHTLSPSRRIQLHLPEHPVMVQADHTRIEQVVTNYLTNALRYSGAGTPISVSLEVREHQARVSVRDAGQGIPAEER